MVACGDPIDISHQMEETFLVRTIKAAIRGVDVRYQNTAEIAKDVLCGFSFASVSVYERYFLEVSENPHIPIGALNRHLHLVSVD